MSRVSIHGTCVSFLAHMIQLRHVFVVFCCMCCSGCNTHTHARHTHMHYTHPCNPHTHAINSETHAHSHLQTATHCNTTQRTETNCNTSTARLRLHVLHRVDMCCSVCCSDVHVYDCVDELHVSHTRIEYVYVCVSCMCVMNCMCIDTHSHTLLHVCDELTNIWGAPYVAISHKWD